MVFYHFLCRVLKVNCNLLDVIYTYNDAIYTCECDVKSEIEVRKCKLINKNKTVNNVSVRRMLLVSDDRESQNSQAAVNELL